MGHLKHYARRMPILKNELQEGRGPTILHKPYKKTKLKQTSQEGRGPSMVVRGRWSHLLVLRVSKPPLQNHVNYKVLWCPSISDGETLQNHINYKVLTD